MGRQNFILYFIFNIYTKREIAAELTLAALVHVGRSSPRYLTQHNGTLRKVRRPPIGKNGALPRHFGAAKIASSEANNTKKSFCI